MNPAHIFSRRFLIFSIFLAIVYFLVNVYLLNYRLVWQTLLGDYPVVYKSSLMQALFEGAFTIYSSFNMVMLILISLFTGANTYLIAKRIKYIHHLRKLTKEEKKEQQDDNLWGVIIGMGSVLGLLGSSCASCSLPILALLGLGGSVALLPFKGAEIPVVSLTLLIVSFVFLIKSQLTAEACKI